MRLSQTSILFSVSLCIFVSALAFLSWRFFIRDIPLTGTGEATLSTRFANNPVSVTDTPIPPPRLRELFSAPVHSLFVSNNDSSVQFYEEETGRIFSVDLVSLHSRTLSEERLSDLKGVRWSPSGIEVIALFDEKRISAAQYISLVDGATSEFPEGVRLFVFSPDGERVAYIEEGATSSRIMVSAKDGTTPHLLLTTRSRVVSLAWPHPREIALQTVNDDGSFNLLAVGLSGTPSLVMRDRSDLDVVWSPDGSLALASYQDRDAHKRLVIQNRATGEEISVPFSVPASKCAWEPTGTSIGCGVPSQTVRSGGDTFMTYHIGSTEPILRYHPPEEARIIIRNPSFIQGTRAVVFLNGSDKKPYLLSWEG